MIILSMIRVNKETEKKIKQLCEWLITYPQLLVNVKVVDIKELLNDKEID